MKKVKVELILNFSDDIKVLTKEDILDALNEFDTSIDEIKNYNWVV